MTRSMLVTALLFTAVGSAAADCPPRGDAAAPIVVHVTRDATGTRVVIDTPIEVCGRPPAPAVLYLAPAFDLEYRWAAVELDFLPLIIRSVQAAPFAGAK